MANRALKIGFIAVVAVLCLVPSVGLLWAHGASTTESELADAPVLFEGDGSVNLGVLSDAGDWFADHFAYREELVDAYSRLKALFGASATDQVVVGSRGWLYYGGTLADYQGASPLSDRALRNIAHNLKLAQSYVEAQGASFAFAVAPNKNTLYPENMPYFYVRSEEPSNFERLKPLLDEAGVSYVDWFSLFEDEVAGEAGAEDAAGSGAGHGEDAATASAGAADGARYLLRDSHWDNRGALQAAQELLHALGRDELDLDEADALAREDFTGDLEGMLFPKSGALEVNWYFEGVDDGEGMSGSSWSYVEGAAVTDSWARTESAGEGSLLMFRDSFGNALDPFLATSFGRAAFSKLVPYNLGQAGQVEADAVVIERAERHLGYLAENPPVMPAPRVKVALDGAAAAGEPAHATISATQDGSYWRIRGTLDRVLVDDAKIYVVVGSGEGAAVYEAAWMTAGGDDGARNDFGYQAHIAQSVIDSSEVEIGVYATVDGTLAKVGSSAFGDCLVS